MIKGDFHGGPVVRNLPCNARDVGSIRGQGTKTPSATGQLSPCTQLLNLRMATKLQHSQINKEINEKINQTTTTQFDLKKS